jgi:hypothetical protein
MFKKMALTKNCFDLFSMLRTNFEIMPNKVYFNWVTFLLPQSMSSGCLMERIWAVPVNDLDNLGQSMNEGQVGWEPGTADV